MQIDGSLRIEEGVMNADWRESDRDRPDPYLDWEYRTRRIMPKDGESWCSVRIQVIPIKEDYLLSLCELRDAVEKGSLPDDKAKPDYLTIRMSDDEFRHLCDLIEDIASHKVEPPFENVQMQFFIYRLESFVYTKGGGYGQASFYVTIDTGPPIEDLHFNKQGAKRSPLVFGPASLIASATVAIGIIDDGIAFAHERFRSDSQKSRIEALWIQQIEHARVPDRGVVFGKRLDKDCINQYLKTCETEDEIYRAVGVTDFRCNIYNPLASRATHGTHVLDLASGGSSNRPIFAVQLPSVATIDTSGVTMGSYVLQAVRMIMVWADRFGPKEKGKRAVPLVINFSYGLWAGPKDGTQHIEKALTELVEYRNKHVGLTQLVLPAGNSYRARATARINLKPKEYQVLDWVVLPDDATPNYIEIWFEDAAGSPARCPVEVMLTPPEGVAPYPICPEAGVMNELVVDDEPIAGVYYDAFATRERLVLVINPTVRNDQHRDLAPSGRWKVSIGNSGGQTITAHFYVQRDDTPFGYPRRGRQSRFDHPLAYERDEKTGDYRQQARDCPIIYEDTLSSIATCSPGRTIVVGAAEATDDHPPADYTSSGPTRLRPGPDNSAFADDGDAHWGRLAAGTFSGSVVAMRGTSVAAPQIVRRVANDLQTLNMAAYDASNTSPVASALSVKGDVIIPVLPADQARLGISIFRPAPDVKIPKRRYPAVKELERGSDDCGGG
jgi:hypothetical protein